ncbi:MAG: tRNA pseudouridine(55) synthase TruB, partial [Actinobacteria bacterium]|nr:tRNA pseudouridine(55) synthase TruB [Actinomycetota bacterium]
MVDGIVLVDKPQGPTSHDVVRKLRKIFNTKKVGHAGTLDPMATGMLIIGVGKATRLLGYLSQSEKEYVGTIRLGISTTTDDAQGEVVTKSSTRGLTQAQIIENLRDFRGHIMQRPSSVSAIQVDGKRAYARVRAGEEVELPLREVTLHDCVTLSTTDNPELDVIDIEVRVVCSAGTYIRAIARDLGNALGVGGHLISLRRTRSGPFTAMSSLEQLALAPEVLDLTSTIRSTFKCVQIDEEQTERALHGVRVPAPIDASGTVGVLGDNGQV